MKRFLILFVVLNFVFSIGTVFAKDLTFVYVGYDRTMPVVKMSQRLQFLYDAAIKNENAIIFYLPNGTSSKIVEVNTSKDNRSEFEDLIATLQSGVSHVMPGEDVRKISSMFCDRPFYNEEYKLLYDNVDFHFYVASLFWKMRYNESVIARLYWALDMEKLLDNRAFNIHVSYDSGLPIENADSVKFGEKNLNNINKNIFMEEY